MGISLQEGEGEEHNGTLVYSDLQRVARTAVCKSTLSIRTGPYD